MLVTGEHGTGKELVSRAIHSHSRRREQPFVAVNCASFTENLLDNELFGHEKGAFTDAHESRPGKFELANHGTLFLDEIGDLSLGGQAKMLRVLEQHEVVRIGGSDTIVTDVRIIAATNRDLKHMVRDGTFREDLFFRLNVVTLEVPPLRCRPKDILLLAQYFLKRACDHAGRGVPQLDPSAIQRLMAYSWPGNVRELRNIMERITYLSTDQVVRSEDLESLHESQSTDHRKGQSLSEATHDFQITYIRQLIEDSQGNMTEAARRMGLHRSNLYRKMNQLGMPTGENDTPP